MLVDFHGCQCNLQGTHFKLVALNSGFGKRRTQLILMNHHKLAPDNC